MPLAPATPAPAALADLLRSLDLEAETTPVFLNFFRSDCPWCQSDLPRLAEAYGRHNDLHIHVLAVAVGDDNAESATAFAAEHEWPFAVVADESGTLRAGFGVERVPTVVLVGGTGLVECTYEGATEQLAGILEQTIFAAAHGTEPPEYHMVGNGCAP